MKETWKPVSVAPGYEVSDCGHVRTYRPRNGRGPLTAKPRPLKLIPVDGYRVVNLYVDGVTQQWYVHRLVAIAFLGDQSDKYSLVRHLDDNRANNVVGNLAWGGEKDNAEDAKRNDRLPYGENHGRAKVTEDGAREVFRLKGLKWSERRIAAHVGLSRTGVRKILSGENWAHLGLANV